MDRLRTLDERRIRHNELHMASERAQIAEQRLAAARARRPWVLAALLALVAGLGVSTSLYFRAVSERNRANRETAVASTMNRFLANDLLGRSDPFHSGKSEETLVDAVKQASPTIDRQFRDAPEIAARLHHSIARALDNRSDFPGARPEYDRAAALYLLAGGPLSQDAIIVGLQRAAMEARDLSDRRVGGCPLHARGTGIAPQEHRTATGKHGRVARVGARHDRVDRQRRQDGGLPVQLASDRAQKLELFDASARLTLKQRLAFAYIRLGDGAKAERFFRELIAAFSATDGPASASVLRVRLNLAQAFMIQGKNQEAIQETSSLYPLYVAKLGETHEAHPAVVIDCAQCEGAAGLWDDAMHDDMTVYQLAVRKQGPLVLLRHRLAVRCRPGAMPRRTL